MDKQRSVSSVFGISLAFTRIGPTFTIPSTSVLDIIPEGILCESTKGNFEDITETNGEW